MALRDVAADIKNHLETADTAVMKVLQDHLPQLVAVAEKYENSPIIQALETAVLPPEVEQQIAAMINAMAKHFPPPAAPSAPAEPAA